MKRFVWAAIGPSVLVLAVGAAFLHMRLDLDHAQSITKVEHKAGDLSRLALTCLGDVGSRLMARRGALTDVSPAAIAVQFGGDLGIKGHCETVLFVASDAQVILSVPELARTKFPELPVNDWKKLDPMTGEDATQVPIFEGPYENASQEWYVVARVAAKPGSTMWIAEVIPLTQLFDQHRLKEIIDLGVGVRLSGITGPRRERATLYSLGTEAYAPAAKQEVAVGQNSILLEFSPALNGLFWRAAFVYGSLILIGAISACVIGYEVSAEQRRLKSEINRRDENLRESKLQLNQVMRESRGAEQYAIGAAYQDVITGLPNWLYFRTHLERSVQRPGRTQEDAVIVVLTEFEHLLDLQRRLDGQQLDKLLVEVVARFEGRLRPEDLMATRLGQGEFAFLLFNSGGEQAEVRMVREFGEALEQPFVIDDITVIVSIKWGIASSHDFPDSQQLILNAETALLRGKLNAGVQAEAPGLVAPRTAAENKDLADVKTAIERDELRLDYLPIISLADRRVLGLEVLVRWHHPFKGTIPPSRFIPLAEVSGQGVFLTKWVLNESIRQLTYWRRKLVGIDDVFISINLTPHEFGRAGLCSLIETLLEESNLPPSRLHLELDEEILGGDVRVAVELTKRLQQMGIELAFEEFGAGHSALSSLRMVNWNSVKVARSFGSALATSPEQQQSLRALTHMAQDLGIACVGKAIETELAATQFASLGYQFGQGFLFYKPLNAQRTEAVLERRVQLP